MGLGLGLGLGSGSGLGLGFEPRELPTLSVPATEKELAHAPE